MFFTLHLFGYTFISQIHYLYRFSLGKYLDHNNIEQNLLDVEDFQSALISGDFHF